jgi:hypothetical protein
MGGANENNYSVIFALFAQANKFANPDHPEALQTGPWF